MRIMHIVHQYLPDHVGGTELYTHWLVRGLRQRGHQVTVFFRRDAEGKGLECWDDALGARICAAWSGRITPERRFLATFGDRHLYSAFQQVTEDVQPDLVHIQHLMGLPVALAHQLIALKTAYVVTLHDYWWVCANAQLLTNYDQRLCEGPRAYVNCARCALTRAGQPRLWPAIPALSPILAWRNRLLRRVVRAADCAIAPSAFVRDWYAKHGVRTDCLVVIPHGLDPANPIPQRPGKSDSRLRFAYIGGLSPQKGIHILLDAFAGVKGMGELWIAGDESAAPDYVALLRAGTPPDVHFLGKLAREGVWDALSRADVVVVPSLWNETFSFLVSEAFAAGVPVIASRLGALAERVRDGVDGFLVPPGDVAAWRAALQRLLDEPDLANRLRGNVRPPTTLDEHLDQIESRYCQLASRG